MARSEFIHILTLAGGIIDRKIRVTFCCNLADYAGETIFASACVIK